MIEGLVGRVRAGDLHPVKIMAVINLSRESFYQGSVAGPEEALALATAMQDQGADLIDLGAVSTAPGSPLVDQSQERERLIPALREILDCLEIDVSVDTQRASIAKEALSLGAACINDVSGLLDPEMASTVADHNSSLIIMASRQRPGDLLLMDDIISILGERTRIAAGGGVSLEKIFLDPGIGRWIPEKTPEYDLALLDGFERLRILERPLVAAISRKSFIGAKLDKPDPADRLAGSLAATAIAVYNGAHLVRTHDVSASLDIIRMASAIRGKTPGAKGKIWVELVGWLGQGRDLQEMLRRMEVDPGGWETLCRKGSFRVLAIKGLSSMEAIIIKQEMLARGGDAAIPKLALRCDPQPEDVLVLGTSKQIESLVINLRLQPFRLSQVATAIEDALKEIYEPGRYR